MKSRFPIAAMGLAAAFAAGSAGAQPALPDPEPAMMNPTPASTPSLFVPFDPGSSRPLLPAATPQAVRAAPESTQSPAAPSIPVAPAVPVLPTATPAATRTPATRGTPVPLFVPSDYGTPTPAPQPTPDSEPPPPVEEDFIPGDTGPDLSAPPQLLDLEPSSTVGEPSVLPAAAASPTPAPKPRPRPASTQSVAPSASQVNSWVVQANRTQDAALATRIGWAFFNREDFGSAGIWFSQALDWDPKLGEAAYGLALTKFRERDLASAEAIVNFRGGSYPKMKALEGDIYVQRSLDYYGMKRYGQSLEYMQKAAACRPLTRDEETILAWNYYQTRNYAEAAEIFERLYNRSRDEQTAQGLYASLSKLQDYEQLDRLATAGGPLKTVYATYEARQYYEAGLYRASADTGGDKIYPELMNLNGPSLALGLGYATKSGTEGEGQLATGVLPIFFGQFSPGEKTIISAWIKRITLDAGTLNNGAQVGNFPRQFEQYAQDPITEYDDLWEFGVGFAYIDWWSFYFALGTTPQNGPLSARPIGNAGIIYRDLDGYFQGEIFSRSVRQSLLSYVGMVDPYTSGNNAWGRVVETGGSLSAFRSIAPLWTVYGNVAYGWLDGSNTEDNTHFSATLAFSREFNVKGFEYVTVGPAFSYEQYDNNQNHFTYGHGGYFSPEYLFQGIIQAQFLTKEGRRWLAAGSVGAGLQTNKQAGAALFPLDPDGRDYPGSESTTGIGLINVSGGYLFNPNWMVGGSAGFNVTADYNEGFINIWVRYFFEPRNGLVRDDLGLQGLTTVY